jgi:hypothetical protein
MNNTAESKGKVASGRRQSGKKRAPEQSASASKSLWEVIDEAVSDVPETVLSLLPADGSERHDHYLYPEAREKKRRKS